jgi:hypothetical protein
MSARMKIFAAVIGIVVVVFITHSNKAHPPRQIETPQTVATPLPAEAPTVTEPKKTVHDKTAPKHKEHDASKHGEDNDDGESNIQPDTLRKLGRVVWLYASWPGQTPKTSLIKELRGEEPFITEDTVKKIETEWNNTPRTFEIAPKKVVNISDLLSSPNQPGVATATVFLTIDKLFKPVSGKPYSQTAVQPYTVKLQIINRQWRIVGIAPQSGSSAASSSS